MPDALIVFDALLGLAIVALAGATLAVRDRFAMIVLFIVFGLMSALSWVRLSAPDVALAEGAIGAGLTGALLLASLHHVRSTPAAEAAQPWGVIVANVALCALIFAGLCSAFLATAQQGPGLAAPVMQNMAVSGVDHPVTAVLLNFRAYDTLMEVVVLLVAVIVVWMVERGVSQAPAPVLGEIYRGFARIVLPAIVIIGAYLLWIGAQAPGGAFQGGAVLAAVGLLMLLTRAYQPQPGHRPVLRAGFILGIATFTAVGLLVTAGGRMPFEYPTEYAKALILLIESMVTVSIAVTLAALFHGREPDVTGKSEERS